MAVHAAVRFAPAVPSTLIGPQHGCDPAHACCQGTPQPGSGEIADCSAARRALGLCKLLSCDPAHADGRSTTPPGSGDAGGCGAARLALGLCKQRDDSAGATCGARPIGSPTCKGDARSDSALCGRHLQPDPLGHADRPDAYANVGGDPINRIDPVGLYRIDVHYYMTYFLAIAAGMRDDDALQLALATQFVDDNPYTTEPINPSFRNQEERLKRYHFTLWTYPDNNTDLQRIVYNTSPDLNNPLSKSSQLANLRAYAMPNEEEGACPIPNGKSLQFMGEFLHAFEDTYAHRDQNDVPIPINLGIGQMVYGPNPGYTYNHFGTTYDSDGFPLDDEWQTNEARTLKMEQDVYSQIVAYMTQQSFYVSGRTSGKIINFSNLIKTLTQFNRTQENEGNSGKFANTSSSLKISRLNDVLGKYGFNPIPDYDVLKACQNRKDFEGGLAASDYPAAILGTPSICPTHR